jgi:hypothetical protein
MLLPLLAGSGLNSSPVEGPAWAGEVGWGDNKMRKSINLCLGYSLQKGLPDIMNLTSNQLRMLVVIVLAAALVCWFSATATAYSKA